MPLQLTAYEPTETDILNAIDDDVMRDPEAIENLTRSLRHHWFLRIPNATPETLRWYTAVVVTNFVDGEKQPFDQETVKIILRNCSLHDLERLRELRNPGECSLEEPYASMRRPARRGQLSRSQKKAVR